LPEDEAARRRLLEATGLAEPRYKVEVKAGPTEYALAFGEGRDRASPFYRPTYLRLARGTEWKPEVVRLGPGLLALLDRPQDFYQQRRLFAHRRVPKGGGSPDQVERVVADRVVAEGAGKGERF